MLVNMHATQYDSTGHTQRTTLWSSWLPIVALKVSLRSAGVSPEKILSPRGGFAVPSGRRRREEGGFVTGVTSGLRRR